MAIGFSFKVSFNFQSSFIFGFSKKKQNT